MRLFVYNLLNLNTLYHFYRQPFVLIFLSTSVGILLADNIRVDFILPIGIITITLIFLFLEVIGSLKNALFSVFMIPIFVAVGAILFTERSSFLENQKLNRVYEKGDVYVLELDEVTKGNGDWNKCIAKIIAHGSGRDFEPLNVKVLSFLQKDDFEIQKGDQLICSASLEKIENKNNPGEFNAKHYWKSKGIQLISFASVEQYRIINHIDLQGLDLFIENTRNYFSKVLSENFSGQNEAVLKAIVLGDKSLLDSETRNSFMNTGAMHVLAVSGLHVGIILYLLMFVFERFSRFISRKTALISLLVLLWIYALITGMSPSVIRAVFMFSMLSLSQISGKNYDAINILFFTAFVLLLYEPLYIYDIGFQLSYLAMLGIFLFYGKIEAGINVSQPLLKKIWQGTAVGLGAQLMTTPLSLAYFHQFPNYFALANLGMMLFSGLILGFGLGIFTVSFIKFLVKPVAFVLGIILSLTIGFLEWVEKLPGAVAYGYDIHFLPAMLIMVGTFVLFFGLNKSYKLALAGTLLIVGVSLVVLDRYNRMNANELCVFNSTKPLVALKKGSDIHCFYAIKKESDLEKVKRTMSDYCKIKPGKVHYHEIGNRKHELRMKKLNFSIQESSKAIEIVLNNQHFRIQSNNEQLADFKGELIGMPWVNTGVDRKLSVGAYLLELP